MFATPSADRVRRARPRSLAPLLCAIVLAAAACSGDEPTGDARPTEEPPTEQPSLEPSPTPLTVSEEELASADLLLFTGEAPQGLDNGGYGLAEDDVSSPGPTITVPVGESVTLVLQNVSDEFIPHDVAVVAEKEESAPPLWGSQTQTIDPGESTLVSFTPADPGTYFYICTLISHMSGHGMWGRFVVEEG